MLNEPGNADVPAFTMHNLYETRHGMFAPPRILWEDDKGENKDGEDKKEDAKVDDKKADDKKDAKPEEEDVDEGDEELDPKDGALIKHLKTKVNRTNRQNSSLREAKKTLTGEVTTVKAELTKKEAELQAANKELQELKNARANETVETQLLKIGVSADNVTKARKLLEDGHYKEVEKEVDGKKVKVKEIDADKFKTENPFLFGRSVGGNSGSSTGGNQKKWAPQGGQGSDDKKTSTSAITGKFKGPASARKNKS